MEILFLKRMTPVIHLSKFGPKTKSQNDAYPNLSG